MLSTNLEGLLGSIRSTDSYTPLFEGIINAIQSIEEGKRRDGEIVIRTIRPNILFKETALAEIEGFVIEDNGMGFNRVNLESFETAYSPKKIYEGGKGFGRFSFLKVFSKVEIESVFEEDGEKKGIRFNFSVGDNGISTPEEIKDVDESTPIKTKITLTDKNIDKLFDKQIQTIARKIAEHFLLIFAQNSDYLPKIKIQDSAEDPIELNDYFQKTNDIISMGDKKISCENGEDKVNFEVKIFKVFYSENPSAITLCAHNREVTNNAISNFIPEFQKHFEEVHGKNDTEPSNYSIKAYVLGKYLDDNISLERNRFNFPKEGGDLLNAFSQRDIERKAAEALKEQFKGILQERFANKIARIDRYIDSKEPWYKKIKTDMDFSDIPEDISDSDLSIELHRKKGEIELKTKQAAGEILQLESDSFLDEEKVGKILEAVTELGKSELIHYVASRKVILDIFEKSLQIKETGKYETEDVIHDIVFPRKKDSDSVDYEGHNLWLLDERLNFHEYLSSDKPLQDGTRPDIIVFDKAVVMREGNEATNPVTIFEFKRPQKTTFKKSASSARTDDPVKQIADYVDQIRSGKVLNPEGRPIKINDQSTPFYGFIVCDLTEQARNLFSKDYSLMTCPDNEGYFGFHAGFRIYFEIMSFDKMLKNATLRSKIFFKKLGIE